MPRSLQILVAACAVALIAACQSTPKPAEAPQPPQPPEKAQEMSPKDRARIHTELAAGYYERGQMDVALDELGISMKLDPANAGTYNVYGLVYATVGEDARSEQNFRRALELAPQDSDIRHNWGWFLCTHGRPRDSIPEFELAIRNPLYKTPETALINAGNCSEAFGDNAGAEVFFKRALSVSPGNATAAYGLAKLMYRTGRFEETRGLMKVMMQQTTPTAGAFYLGACIERKLGDKGSEASYTSQLKNRYPDSPESRALTAGYCE